MSYVKRKTEVAEAPSDFSSGNCYASGCALRGSVSLDGGGRWFCSHHAWAEPKHWPGITAGLREHDWMSGLIGDIRKLLGEGKRREAVEFSREFWAEYPDMQPNDHEAVHVEAYVYRLHLDLQHRAGALEKKPAPMRPQRESWKSSRAQLSQEIVQ